MSVIGSNVLAGASGQASAPVYEIERSLRFDSSSSTYLSRTPSSAGNRKTWTWSAWVKKGDIISSGRQRLFSVRQSTTSNQTYIQFRNDNKLYVEGPAIAWLVNTDAIFRDPGAWGHVVVAFDTTQATASNRVRIYWNGVEQTLSGTFPTQDYADSHINNTLLHSIGNEGGAVAEFFNGYLAEIHHIDGQQLTASDFGELDSNGVWQPKEFTGSYDQSSGGRTIANSTGAVPLLNTSDADGQAVSSGVRTDSNASSIVLALPLNGSNGGTTITDYHHTIKGSGSAKAITLFSGSSSGGAVTSTAVSKYYGSSFYVVRGGVNANQSDYITRTGDSDLNLGTGDFCVEFWFHPTSLDTNFVMFDNRHPTTGWPNSSNGFAIIGNGGGSIFSYSGGNQIIAHGNKLTAGQWHHIAYTRDGSTERLFVNGDFFGTTASSSRNYNESRFLLGSSAPNGEGSTGYFQDLRIYVGAAKYTSNFTVPELGVGGVNSFYLKFDDNSSTAALGTDSSGLSNTYTVNNLSVASGSGNDSLIDTPTNYNSGSGNNRGNYATFNPLHVGNSSNAGVANGADFSDGNLRSLGASGKWAGAISTMPIPSSGKWYFEFTCLGSNSNFGLFKPVYALDGTIRTSTDSKSVWYGFNGVVYYYVSSTVTDSSTPATYTTNDVIGIAVDSDAYTVKYYKNNSLQYTQTLVSALQTELDAGNLFPGADTYSSVNATVDFGQQGFTYTPPTGYVSLCTQNLTNTTVITSGTYVGTANADGPFVNLNGVPTAMTIGGSAVTFGTGIDRLSNGFKIRSSTTNNSSGTSYSYSVTTAGDPFKNARAQTN